MKIMLVAAMALLVGCSQVQSHHHRSGPYERWKEEVISLCSSVRVNAFTVVVMAGYEPEIALEVSTGLYNECLLDHNQFI